MKLENCFSTHLKLLPNMKNVIVLLRILLENDSFSRKHYRWNKQMWYIKCFLVNEQIN